MLFILSIAVSKLSPVLPITFEILFLVVGKPFSTRSSFAFAVSIASFSAAAFLSAAAFSAAAFAAATLA